MKNECYLVGDLLPSYSDQLCSEESKQFIEQHLKQCDSCTQMLHQMKEELAIAEQLDIPVRSEQKKPFEKISRFMKAQVSFMKFLKGSFWLSLCIAMILLVIGFNDLISWYENQQEEQRVEQQQQEIMNDAFAAIETEGAPDERALQDVMEKYQAQLQHIAVFPAANVEENITSNQTPATTFPIDYEKAIIVVGEEGKIEETVVPSDYDIGTMVMAEGEWVVQFEYKESYLNTVENAFQIKHYSPEVWELFLLPALFTIVTLFILVCWRYQKRIIKPVEYIVT